jgi:hypothetical protein
MKAILPATSRKHRYAGLPPTSTENECRWFFAKDWWPATIEILPPRASRSPQNHMEGGHRAPNTHPSLRCSRKRRIKVRSKRYPLDCISKMSGRTRSICPNFLASARMRNVPITSIPSCAAACRPRISSIRSSASRSLANPIASRSPACSPLGRVASFEDSATVAR